MISDAAALNRFTFVECACPICGSQAHHTHYVIAKFEQGNLQFVTCDECQTIYQSPRPDINSMLAFYSTQNFFQADNSAQKFVGYYNYDAEEQTRVKNAHYRIHEVEDLFPSKKRLSILKIACGYGTCVKLARDKGHDAHGIDFSEIMVRGAKERYGIDLIHNDFLKHDFGDKKFDVVLLYGAINNFVDVMAVGRKVNEILLPDGCYLSNFVEPRSIIERIQGSKFWLYRPPIIGIWTGAAFIKAHAGFGMELVGQRIDIQWASLGKLIGYLQISPLMWLARVTKLEKIFVKLPIPGYAKVILRKTS